MARQTNVLDDMQLRRWMVAGKPVAKSDGDGLTFTLSASGTAAWILRYRLAGGRRRELTLGNYPDLSLAAARKAARAHRVAIDNGADPAAAKKTERAASAAAWTVNALVADFRVKRFAQDIEKPLSASTIYYRTWDLDNVVGPKLGSLEVRKVTSLDVIQAIEDAGRGWTMSKRILTTMTQVFDHACGRKIIAANPCAGVKLTAIMGARPKVRPRVMLGVDELAKILPGIDDTIGRANGLMLRVLLATCVRTNELVKARKEFIDLQRGTWFVADDTVKTRNGFLVPLVPLVASWFEELLALSGDSPWLLPARGQRRINRLGDTHVGNTTLWAAIDRAFRRGGLEARRFTPHDTRSTAKGHMMNMGIPKEITEIALNHKLKGMEGIYDVRREIPERRLALEQWAEVVAACADGREADVIAIRPRLSLVA
ncbi:tyrosine-type recombinase/integrase [Burkholderia cenocepacia]|uniref:Tyrosine-type recombinase/integrase n=1 Tax=Burkholderia cenocepacia TaxID=95486 RepID=A0ABD4USV3_9BURK|nr:site-specific integrase [Burkholderia cenocepacia]MCW3701466.1 tyrosine-type recombinase/integrase [Burkholderia cenocepacia]MCW3704641.1 tyrosine-type recombinase/integrase [Burkholderia cenocepacia]MCW3717475.1 tyrosine-type recombinase/integrase [Burkholderia cenocepacia]MCW3720585.1 tyrosine-type recombinase/integrase [Burkholderia cenocepacia]MCW3729683.1 tyrosine-type recombinase/integrase [Burkholderia cenocepacia]